MRHYRIGKELGRRAVFAAGASLMALAWPGVASAQALDDDLAEETEPTGADDLIVVTGSRVVRAGYDAPTPTTVLGREAIDSKAPATIVEALATLPSLRGVATPEQNGGGANSGSGGQSFVNARGLGATRTLVLLDGQRFVPSTATGAVDIAILPVALLERVDVVTGGASAAYGSDAVAGVVNFVLNNRFEGLKGEMQAGITERGDNRTIRGSLAWGSAFADRGHIVLTAEGLKAGGVLGLDRPFGAVPLERVFTNPAFTSTNGEFQRLRLPYVYFNRATFGGVITSGPLAGTTFLPGGETGTVPQGVASGTALALDGPADLPFMGYGLSLYTPLERWSAYGRVSWDIDDSLTAYATGVIADSTSGPQGVSASNTLTKGTLTIRRDNAFLPGSVRSQMTDLGLETITVGRYNYDWGDILSTRGNLTKRGVVGIQGGIGNGWEIDVYAQYGTNKNTFVLDNNVMWDRVVEASDAVRHPTTNQIVCRSSLTNPGNGCVPLNIFGVRSGSPAAVAAVQGRGEAELKTTQTVLSASISGEPVSTWAGPVSVAAGVEYRRETADQEVDALSAANAFVVGNPKALTGELDVKEGFVEAVVPLAEDVPLLRLLELNAAARLTDYSTSGTVTTWKVGANWSPLEDLRFRATRSRDIRAPNLLELFTGPFEQGANLINPFTDPPTTGFISARAGGNPNLTPEISDTIAAGVVYQPHWFPGFQASVDYYNIKIRDAIGTLGVQDVVDRCFDGSTQLCELITRDSTGQITAVVNPYLNIESVKTDGVDFDVSYRTPFAGGRLAIQALASYVISFETSDGINATDTAGSVGSGQPHWSGDLTVSYAIDRFRGTVNTSYFGGGTVNNTYVEPTAIDDNRVPARAFVDLQLAREFEFPDGSQAEVYFNVSNLFDTTPPLLYAPSGGPNYDRIGRAFRLGVRFQL